MFLMPADPLRGQVGGGWALEIESFLSQQASAIWDPKNLIFPGPNVPYQMPK